MLRYDIVRRVGKGAFGTVLLVRRKADTKHFVLKQMKIGSASAKEKQLCHQEVTLLERLDHPCITGYEESFVHSSTGETTLCVVMAYCDGGDLAHFVKNQRGKALKEKQILAMFVEVALALQFVHARHILHRDLKTQNIFIKNGQLKLGDFGISKVLTSSKSFAQTMIGTPYYMSPEVFKGKQYSFKSDVWALGCVLYELITFRHAFDANNLQSLAVKVVRGKYIPISAKYRKETRMLIDLLLNVNQSARPTMNEVLKTPILKNRIRDFVVSCYNKMKNGKMADKTYAKLQKQLTELGMEWIFNDIEQISQQHLAKKAEKELNKKEAVQIEAEKKTHKDMQLALEKLRNEKKWRADQRRAQKIRTENGSHSNHSVFHSARKSRHNSNKPLQRKSKPASQYPMSARGSKHELKREAATRRRESLQRREDDKRNLLIAKRNIKLDRANERKSALLNKQKSASVLSAAKQRRQSKAKYDACNAVEQLNQWDRAHSTPANPSLMSPIADDIVTAPKSRLSLLQNKMRQQQEYSALEKLRKRRESIQKRLTDIQSRKSVAKKSPSAAILNPKVRTVQSRNRRVSFGTPTTVIPVSSPNNARIAAKRRKPKYKAPIMKPNIFPIALSNRPQTSPNNIQTKFDEMTLVTNPQRRLTNETHGSKSTPNIVSPQNVNILSSDDSDDISITEQEEIEELQKTLTEHTKELERLRSNVSKTDDSDSGSDVESLLEKQERKMSQNNEMKAATNDDDESDNDSSSSSSSDHISVGSLANRIENIKNKCIKGMGLKGFHNAYAIMKQLSLTDNDETISTINQKIAKLCKDGTPMSKVSKYRSLIDQLLFIEANCV